MKINARDSQILRLALPSIVQNITVPLLGLADVAIVGHIGNARYIGAIAVGSMIFNVMYWLFGFLRMGTSGLTAQAWGRHRLDESMAVLWRGLTLALTLGAVMVAIQVPLRHLTFALMHPTDDVAALCHPYFRICIYGAPAVLGLYALMGWFVGMQNTRTPMVIAIGQNVVNIAASLLLVFGGGMAIEGVALGTLIAQWTGFLATLALWWRYYGRLRRYHTARQSKGAYAAFLRTNRDIFLRTLCLVAVNLYFTAAGAAQGALVLAVNTLLMQFFTLFSYFLDGFAFAAEALAGRYYGAGQQDALRDTVRRLMRWGWSVVVVFTLLYIIGGTGFLHLLTSDREVISAAHSYLPWAWLIPAAGVGAFVWDGVFIGITHTRGMLWACAVAAAAFFTLWFGLSPWLDNHALWLALLVYLALRGLVQTFIFRQHIAPTRAHDNA